MAPQVTSRVQPLEEDPVIVKESISTLRELVAAEPKLHVRTDDLFMMKYLRCADLDPQRAFQRMKQYYKLKANCKDWFASTSPREQKEVLQQHITTMLRERDCYGRRVLICKLADAALWRNGMGGSPHHVEPGVPPNFDKFVAHAMSRVMRAGACWAPVSTVSSEVRCPYIAWPSCIHTLCWSYSTSLPTTHLTPAKQIYTWVPSVGNAIGVQSCRRSSLAVRCTHGHCHVPILFVFVRHGLFDTTELNSLPSPMPYHQLIIAYWPNADPGKVTAYQWSHTDDLWLETALEEEETQKNGISVIVDAGNIPWKFLKFANPFNATFVGRKSDALPVRHIEHHVVNTSFFMNALIALVFPFLSNRTKESIHFHYQDRASLHKFINPEILPEEYGGKVPEIEYEEQEKYLHEKEDVLLALPGETPESLLAASDEYFTGAQMVPSSGAHKNIVEEVSMAQQVKKERHLSAEWVQRASEELNEKPEKIHDDINTLRSMIVAETNLHVPADDAFLLRFLRARKFNCTKAFHMLQRYYVMKLRCPELFKIPRPSEKKYILEMQAQNMLEDRDGFGRRVYIFRVEKCDSANVSIEDVFRTNVLALEQVVDEPETQIAGLTVIVDMNGFGIQHAKFLSPYYARRTVEVIQETFPLRFKGFHVINEPFYFDAVFAVLKPFLKEKIRKRIYFHGRDLSSLHAFISPDILPEEYGGKKACFDNKTWRMALLANEDKLVELETYGYKVDEESS
uniref:CRAL-TRIO domain-containing protein n=1 Tax=Timema tahoe TaxID=61484 RepID=A0A7R9FLR7_9NEOP|nr:unnamed protein product [Timema tahoe]